MSTVGGNIHSNAPGVALKAVPDMTFTAFCKRSSSTVLLAGYVKLHELEESSCLWRKKLTSLSTSHHTQDPHLFSLSRAGKGSLEPRKSADKIHAPHGCSPRASATAHTHQLLSARSEPDARRKTGFTPHAALL